MHADSRRIDHLHGCVMRGGESVHYPTPDARPSPANETIVASGVRAKIVRQIAPRCSGTQDPKDAVQHAPVIYTRHATRLVWQERLDGCPFIVGEFVAHDSRLLFWDLESQPVQSDQRRTGGAQRRIVAFAATHHFWSLLGQERTNINFGSHRQ